MTTEEYLEWKEEFDKMPRIDQLRMMFASLRAAIREDMAIGYDPNITSSILLCMRDKDLVDDIDNERKLILLGDQASVSDTVEGGIELAIKAINAYRRAPGIVAVLRALRPHLNGNIGIVYKDMGYPCLVLIRDIEVYDDLMGNTPSYS